MMHLMNHFNPKYPLPAGDDAVSDAGPGLLAVRPPHRGELRGPEVQRPAVHVPGQRHRQGRHDGQDVLLSRRHQQRSRGIVCRAKYFYYF